MGELLSQLVFAAATHLDAGSHASQEVQDGEDNADIHCNNEVGEERQDESHEQDDDIRRRRTPYHLADVTRAAHVPCDHEQDRREHCKRHMNGQRRAQKDDQHEHEGMHDSGHRACRAVAHVRRGAGECPGDRETAEQGRDHVGNALADQFLVGVMARARRAVDDDSREQRFDGPEHGDRKGRADEFDYSCGGQRGPVQGGRIVSLQKKLSAQSVLHHAHSWIWT